MAKTREYAFVYLFGGIMYGLMEVIWRGHTHWTMTLTGGTALLILYIINIKMSNCNIYNNAYRKLQQCYCRCTYQAFQKNIAVTHLDIDYIQY